ncbi:MAG TPA: SRPBCC domain-containing protein [Nitrospiria bacterium]|jgi:uncharacterized protein YndB with AHSA1/START domain
MTTKNTRAETILQLKRTFSASREKVFKAWTDPEMLKEWFGPEEVQTVLAEVDLKIGGKYRFEMKLPDGKIVSHQGAFREIKFPERLVYSWILEGQSCKGSEDEDCETLVSLDFKDLGGSTELTLTHEFLPSEKSRQGHEFGWTGSFDKLEKVI